MSVTLRFEHGELIFTRQPTSLGSLTGWGEADFSISIDDRVLFSFSEFPVVELAYFLDKWLEDDGPQGRPFDLISADFEEVGVVWIHPQGAEWRVGSTLQDFEESRTFSFQEIAGAIDRFVSSVRGSIDELLGRPGLQMFEGKTFHSGLLGWLERRLDLDP